MGVGFDRIEGRKIFKIGLTLHFLLTFLLSHNFFYGCRIMVGKRYAGNG